MNYHRSISISQAMVTMMSFRMSSICLFLPESLQTVFYIFSIKQGLYQVNKFKSNMTKHKITWMRCHKCQTMSNVLNTKLGILSNISFIASYHDSFQLKYGEHVFLMDLFFVSVLSSEDII